MEKVKCGHCGRAIPADTYPRLYCNDRCRAREREKRKRINRRARLRAAEAGASISEMG
jgi:predicted nucleic acid-binding Zn ribbon protein